MSKTKLGDIADILMGQSPVGKDCNTEGIGIPLLNGPTEFGAYHPHPIQFTTGSKKLASEGDILFCVRGSTTGRMNYADQTYSIGRGIASIKGKNDYPTTFVRAVLECNLNSMLQIATGSTFPNLGKDALNNFEVELVSSQDAQKISPLIEKLEQKILNNTLMNATLEKIAQRIFKSWFVDFDPVKANAEDVPFDGLSPEIQSLFPNEFEESELGMIPKGWEVNIASNSFKVYGGYAFKSKDFTESGTPVIKIKNISSNRTVDVEGSNCVESFDEKKLKKFVLSDGDILMAMTGATVGKSGIFANLNSKALLNQRVAKITGINDETCWFSYLNVISDSFFDTVVKQAYGSAQPNISSNDIGNIKIITPTENIKAKFNKLMTPLFERWITNRNQEQLLSKIRDKLLPRLISGKITIQKAEELLEEVS